MNCGFRDHQESCSRTVPLPLHPAVTSSALICSLFESEAHSPIFFISHGFYALIVLSCLVLWVSVHSPLTFIHNGNCAPNFRDKSDLGRSRSIWGVLSTFLMTQQVKSPPAMQETQEMRIWSLGQEVPLTEEMATHSSILAWKIPWTEEPGRLQSKGCKALDMTEQLITHARHTQSLKSLSLNLPTLKSSWGGFLLLFPIFEGLCASSMLLAF